METPVKARFVGMVSYMAYDCWRMCVGSSRFCGSAGRLWGGGAQPFARYEMRSSDLISFPALPTGKSPTNGTSPGPTGRSPTSNNPWRVGKDRYALERSREVATDAPFFA